MRGLNLVVLTGNVAGDLMVSEKPAACSFLVVSDRKGADGKDMEACVRVNVYAKSLLALARGRVAKGAYVVVRGELMNREVQHGRVTEVRAHELLVTTRPVVEEAGRGEEEG